MRNRNEDPLNLGDKKRGLGPWGGRNLRKQLIVPFVVRLVDVKVSAVRNRSTTGGIDPLARGVVRDVVDPAADWETTQ